MERRYARKRFGNLQKRIYRGAGKYNIPELQPVQFDGDCEFIGFNYAKTCKERSKKGLHFFVDDYQFERLWKNPDQYLPMLQQFRCVMTPDFSLYTDFPKAVQIYNHYRKHWIGAYLQEHGVTVIPTVGWSDESSYEWCFDGEPVGSTVAVSSVGTQRSEESQKLFARGYQEMVRRLKPETVIFYGTVPDGCKENIVRIRAFQEKFREAECDGW